MAATEAAGVTSAPAAVASAMLRPEGNCEDESECRAGDESAHTRLHGNYTPRTQEGRGLAGNPLNNGAGELWGGIFFATARRKPHWSRNVEANERTTVQRIAA
jgi:hypothetical protein